MRLRISIRGCDRPSVGPSVRPSVGPSPVIFKRRIWLFLRVKRSSTDIVNNGTMSDDEVVASDVPRGTCSFCRQI